MAVFPKTVPTGLRHGTVTVLSRGESYEVTTFRADGSYADGRHPDAVTFVRELAADLSRRDFTVNAMAMDANGTVTDLFGGREDLRLGLLRCVGDPEQRFREDALRMLRALRFSAQLGFALEEETRLALERCAPLCAGLSAERVREETEKTLLSPRPQVVEEMLRLELLTPCGLRQSRPLMDLSRLPLRREVRWAALFLACGGADWAQVRLEKRLGTVAQQAAALGPALRTELEYRRMAAQYGKETALCTAALSGQESVMRRVLDSGACLSIKELAVSGRDLPHLQGKELGGRLDRLLQHVLETPGDNTKNRLMELSRQWDCENNSEGK